MKKLLLLVAGLGLSLQVLSQNLLDLQHWKVGQGSAGVFNMNGSPLENIREWGIGPHGDRVVLWKAVPDGAGQADGGWNSSPFTIDHEKMYRFTIWIKKTNSNDGVSYFGCQDALNLDNSAAPNAYFWHGGGLPELDKWYLLVGYIHASNDVSTEHYGGIYDGTTGQKVVAINDFKFPVGATAAVHRSYLYYDPNVNDRQYFYAPRVDVVKGEEPSLAALLGSNIATNNLHYFSGNVGIKTPTPRDYELAVNGKIRAKEIKVETANWPDYVFKPDYEKMSLQELDSYIKANGHLPEVPSAAHAEKEGVVLGEMNKILLKKIEELTLHLIEKDRELQQLKTESSSKDKAINELLIRQEKQIQLLKDHLKIK